MPPMANKNLDKCVVLLRQMMDRDSGSVSSSGGRNVGPKKKSKRVSVLPTTTRPKVKKKDGKVATTRKVFSKTKLNSDALKKPPSKSTSIMKEQKSCGIDQLSEESQWIAQHGKTSDVPEHIPVSDGQLHPKSAIHFDKPFSVPKPQRQYSQPLDGGTATCLSRPSYQSDPTLQSGAAPPFNQRLLSSTPHLTPVKVMGSAPVEVSNADSLPLNSTDQIYAVRPPSPTPVIPRLLEGIVAFQPQPGVNLTHGVPSSSRVEPLPAFVGVTSQYGGMSSGQSYNGTGYVQRMAVDHAGNLPNAAWMDDYPVKDSTPATGLAPSVRGQPYVYPMSAGLGHTEAYPTMPFYPTPYSNGHAGQYVLPAGQHPYPRGQHPDPHPTGQFPHTAGQYPNATTNGHPGIVPIAVAPTHPTAYHVPSTQAETRPYPGAASAVDYIPAAPSHSHEETVRSPATGLVDVDSSRLRLQNSKDVTRSPPVRERSAASTGVNGDFELYSECGRAVGSPATNNPRRPPTRTRASDSQKFSSSRMSSGVNARTSKSLDRDPKSASRETKKRQKTKTKLAQSVDAEVQVGTSGGIHCCDCDTDTGGNEPAMQTTKVGEDMEKKCTATKSHLHTLTYLLKELKMVAMTTGHSESTHGEIDRLVREMEKTVSSLLPGVTALSWRTEIDLAMLPLRSENAQLRRRVRILTQQLKEKTREVEEAQKPDPTFEVVQLQMVEHQLGKELAEERMTREKLREEFTLLEQDFRQVTTQKVELLQVLTNKEHAHQKSVEERLKELRDLREGREGDVKEREKQGIQLEEATVKVASLEITLKERDRELGHMHSLVRSLQSNMTSLLSNIHGSQLQISDLDRSRPQSDAQNKYVSEANGPHTQKRADTLPGATSDKDWLTDSACFSRGSESLTPTARSRRELNFNAQQSSPTGATANWAASIQKGSSPHHQPRRADTHTVSSPKHDIVSGTPSRPLRKEDLNQLCGFSPAGGDTSVATDYMVPPGVSPMRKLQRKATHPERDRDEAPTTVKQMLVALAGKIQQQQCDDHVTAAANHSPSIACSEDDGNSTLIEEDEVAWKEPPRDVYNETRYSVTDYFTKYQQRTDAAQSVPNDADSQRPLQEVVYRDTDLDTTISSIHDLTQLVDQSFVSSLASSVSSLASSASVDDQVFREGLNSLDATIAQIQATIRQAMHRGKMSSDKVRTYVK